MKKIKNFIILIISGFAIISCSTDDKSIDLLLDNVERGVILRTIQDPANSPSFNIFDANSVWQVMVEAQGSENGALISEVKVYATFNDNTVEDGDPDYSTSEVGPIKTIPGSAFSPGGPNNFPRTVLNVNFSEALSATGVDAANTDGGDTFLFRLDLVLTDGRIFTNDAGGTVTGGSFFSSPFAYTAALVCPSSLEGTHSYVSTNFQAITGTCPTGSVSGTVTWTNTGGGVYTSSDLGFGQYGTSCWNDSPATSGGAKFTDACNLIISGGLDQYGLIYIWNVVDVTGPELTMSWSNDYGDSGDVVITREGGVDWPPLFSNN